MEATAVKLLFVAAVGTILLSRNVVACGDWSDEAPPLLSWLIDRLPAKSFGHLYREVIPVPSSVEPNFVRELEQIGTRVATENRAPLIKQVDTLLAAARKHYRNAYWCNLLHDVRDVLSSNSSGDEAAGYLRWRLEHADWFAAKNDRDAPREYPPKKPGVSDTPEAATLESEAGTAPPALRPHWLYLRGALGFIAGDREECEQWFERVVREFPAHPRAEAARFLIARCKLVQSRAEWRYSGRTTDYAQQLKAFEEKKRARHAEAKQLFLEQVEKYPRGRFSADVEGWLGALSFDEGDMTTALAHYIRQAEDEQHPEVAKSALFMCQKILVGTKVEDEARFALVAEHPLVAMGTTYLVLNATEAPQSEAEEYFGRSEESVRAKQWRQAVLPRLATEVAKRKDLYQEDAWPPRYLAILAQAASAAGKQDEALKITSIAARKLSESDDLLLARGIALQRAGKASEAIETYRVLLDKFPNSPLARGVRLKLAISLLDHHRAGEALIELKRLKAVVDGPKNEKSYADTTNPYPPSDDSLEITDSPLTRDISAAESEQISQLIDTIYNFAPLPEIAASLAKRIDEPLNVEIRAVLGMRYLEEENFAQAKKFMTEAQFQLVGQRLEALTREAAALSSANAKAAKMMELGNAWEAARGKALLVPLETHEAKGALFHDGSHQAGLRRRENARALGYKNTDAVLEMRDELRHASRWWMRAARAVPTTPLAAQARWRALEAMPRLAAASDYAFQRAAETNAAAISRELFERLRAEAPESREAQRYAVYWTFPTRDREKYEEFVSYPEDWSREIDAVGKMGYRYLDYGTLGVEHDFTQGEDYWDDNRKPWKAIRDRIVALSAQGGSPNVSSLLEEVENLQKEARAAYQGREDASYLATLDDLALFLRELNLTSETRQAYLELRLRVGGFVEQPKEWEKREAAAAASEARIDELLASPQLASVADYVDFIRATRVARKTLPIPTNDFDKNGEPVAIATKDYWTLERAMREFLAKYPSSRKREAARLMLARAVHWLTTPLQTTLEVPTGEAASGPNNPGDFCTVVNTYWREKFDPARAMEPFDAYDREFPEGKYAAEIRDFRGAAARQARDWNMALDLTLAQLGDESHTDLRPEAAVRLANIFAELANPNERPVVLEAIRPRPLAVQRLQQYLTATWTRRDHPLRFLGGYLSEQLGISYERPAATSPHR
jgi:TolA-binding protein